MKAIDPTKDDVTRNPTVALVQMDCALGDKEANLERAGRFLAQCSGRAHIVCFPELFTTGYSLSLIGDDFYDLAEPIPGPTTEAMGEKARGHGLAVLGTIVERDAARERALYDSTFILDAAGHLVGTYRKTHLYPAEHRYFRPGDRLSVFELGGWTAAVAICFEHAFPQIFTILALQGVQLVFIPSAVPVGYEYLLNLRTRARAQDNQFFSVAVNRVGREGEVTYCGLSQVVNPRGEVIAEASHDSEDLLIVELDLSMIPKEREREPVLSNLRPELYQALVEARGVEVSARALVDRGGAVSRRERTE